MVTAYLGLGANLGDRLKQLRQAVEMLHHTAGISVIRISTVYETAPVGYLNQPPFYNLVIEVHTTLSPIALLATVNQVEKKLHRVREVRWGPRTIDIDILLYENRVIKQEDLQIPHPRMKERAFVLIPLRELAPHIEIPGSDQTLVDLIRQLPPDQEIRPLQVDWNMAGLSSTPNR
ncbi:2-amino-4-hydroxy-6-hydroxymethyldihydropteridine diphosphokinase [Paenactinomyces guangxiensis]|uniref:2-amino-4-hydroxy-6-hydroxymethyldihydropteridine diphosphokinase n=1 Tax=Paenactinomyces guangxiensis TaxID=1490290 RepID=A0A7W2A8N9_9BACL|nr:2-amino-4-hydroxy-6-hydroxymethyldihydropteridine diphosphokinase [Paenactinomyces guangxiensis]MBH8592886.1 2-amino-4-hydroxy-6-hydroxymethyldihydropteridine diphosphokinase [Paenactinomyces guangxiensis]